MISDGVKVGRPLNVGLGGQVVTYFAVAVVMLLLDLTWLGVVALDLYNQTMGALKRPDVVLEAAVLFYIMYVIATVRHAVLPSVSYRDAAMRGASLGVVAYATYELTNWAVITNWPAVLVPVDTAWGVALTAVVAVVGRFTCVRLQR